MNITELSIKRPALITSLMIAIVSVGWICFQRMNIDLFPKVDIPIIFVSTIYSGAAPAEIENLITKPLEEEISTISGIKKLQSRSNKDVSQVILQLYQGVDTKYVEQQVRDKINQAKSKLPEDISEPVIRHVDPADQPVLTIALSADLTEGELYDLAEQYISPRLEQVGDVGMVEIIGARKREVHVLLDQDLLRTRQIPLSQVNRQLAASGKNVSIGRNDFETKEQIFRSQSEFNEIKQIGDTIVNFYNNETPTRVSDVGKVEDTLEDEKSRAFINGKKSLFLTVYRQSDSNIVKVVDGVKEQLAKMERDFATMKGTPKVQTTKDASKYIRSNIRDICEAIVIAVILTVLTVFVFLRNSRATIITAMSLPISLIGSFIVMNVADFSINIISLLALSLAVGLLVDDAIVVVENIYRRIDNGEDAKSASISSSREILMAVVAISGVVISVFTPVSFLDGIVGQYLKQFGLTISFAMVISLIVAISIIPVLCAYLSGRKIKRRDQETAGDAKGEVEGFLEEKYEKILTFSIANPKTILLATLVISALSVVAFKQVPKTFMAESDNGELVISLELPADTNLNTTTETVLKIEEIVRQDPLVLITAASAGSSSKQSNRGDIYVQIKPRKERKISTTQFKDSLRKQFKEFSYANPIIRDYDPSGGVARGGQPVNLFLISNNVPELEKYAAKVFNKIKSDERFKDVDISNKATRNEFRVNVSPEAAKAYGVNPQSVGDELRGYVEGYTPTKLRENGLEYEIRVRLKPEQRDLKRNFNSIYVPNLNQKLVKLSDIAYATEGIEPATIHRQDRGRYIQITANITSGVGLGDVLTDLENLFQREGELKIPHDVRYDFSGDSQNIKDMLSSMGFAVKISILFIYLILTALYESFIIPLTILLALPLAFCGGAYALWITGESVNIFTMLGVFMLIAVSGKNSILLIDFTHRLMDEGKSRSEALILAGKARLRPILMTSLALIAGTIPVAIGFSETASIRTAMGVAIIGGLISSTVLTLVVVPAAFSYIDRFKVWIKALLQQIVR